MPQKKILIHAVIARPYDAPSHWGWRTCVKMARDRVLWALGSTALLDYRNYDALYPTNVGDIAIAEAVRNQLLSIFPDCIFDNINWGALGNDRSKQGSYHAIVMAGSGYFHVSREGNLHQRIEKDLAFIKHSNAPLILYGVGVNRGYSNFGGTNNHDCLTKKSESLIENYLQRCSLISVRDRASQILLGKYTDKNVEIVSDPALFLNVFKLNHNHRNMTDEDKRPQIGVNFANHGPLASSILRQNLPLYLDLLRRIYAETGCSFHYFVHSYSELIVPRLLRDKGIKLEVVSGSPYQLSARYSEMTLHIGNMLHSCILAVGAGTPCVLLAYDVKHQGFAEILGLSPHCHDVTRLVADEVLQSIRQILSKNIQWRQRIVERLSMLWSEQLRFINSCATLLNESEPASRKANLS